MLWLAVGGGVLIGLTGLVYAWASGQPVALALTSGEQTIRPLLALGSVGPIAVAVAAKAVVYAVSLGAGFRGGAYFPAMFIGAGCGGALALAVNGSVGSAAAAGITAAVTHLSQVKWVLAVVLGAAVGLLTGGVAMLPVALLAAAVGRAIPRVDPPMPGAPDVGAAAASTNGG